MLELQELDGLTSIRNQLMDESEGPVVLVNVFHASSEQTDALLSAWADDARYLKTQTGFISAQLHRGIAGSGTFLNYAVWESVNAFRAAFVNPVFQAKLAGYPDGVTGSPHLFRKLSVEGVCVA
jgi:heme-degrading monooxygenase HmoA